MNYIYLSSNWAVSFMEKPVKSQDPNKSQERRLLKLEAFFSSLSLTPSNEKIQRKVEDLTRFLNALREGWREGRELPPNGAPLVKFIAKIWKEKEASQGLLKDLLDASYPNLSDEEKQALFPMACEKGEGALVVEIFADQKNYFLSNRHALAPLFNLLDAKTILDLINRGLPLDIASGSIANGQEKTLFHLAAEIASPSLVQCLLEKGPELFKEDLLGRALLFLGEKNSCVRDWIDVLDLVFKKNASKSIPLDQSFFFHMIDRLGELFSSDPKRFQRQRESERWIIEWIEKTLVNRSDDEKKALLNYVEPYVESTPLILAAQYNFEAIAIFLLQAGSNFLGSDMEGTTILHVAIENELKAVFDEVLKQLACLKIEEQKAFLELRAGRVGESALLMALEREREEESLVLLALGANLEAKNRLGDSGFDLALIGNSMRVVNRYQGAFSSVKMGSLVGIRACQNGHEAAALWFIEHGGGLTQRDRNGDAILHAASRVGLVNVVHAILLQEKTLIDLQNEDRETPLIIACKAIEEERPDQRVARWDIAKTLVNQGAWLLPRDSSGRSALDHVLTVDHYPFAFIAEKFEALETWPLAMPNAIKCGREDFVEWVVSHDQEIFQRMAIHLPSIFNLTFRHAIRAGCTRILPSILEAAKKNRGAFLNALKNALDDIKICPDVDVWNLLWKDLPNEMQKDLKEGDALFLATQRVAQVKRYELISFFIDNGFSILTIREGKTVLDFIDGDFPKDLKEKLLRRFLGSANQRNGFFENKIDLSILFDEKIGNTKFALKMGEREELLTVSKSVLSSRSAHFQRLFKAGSTNINMPLDFLFKGDKKGKCSTQIRLDSLKAVLRYLYSQKIEVDVDNFRALALLSIQFELTDLQTILQDWLTSNSAFASWSKYLNQPIKRPREGGEKAKEDKNIEQKREKTD